MLKSWQKPKYYVNTTYWEKSFIFQNNSVIYSEESITFERKSQKSYRKYYIKQKVLFV